MPAALEVCEEDVYKNRNDYALQKPKSSAIIKIAQNMSFLQKLWTNIVCYLSDCPL